MKTARTKAISGLLALVLAGGGLLALLSITAGPAPAGNVDGFYTTWDEAQAAARKADKPLYVHFTTTWCGWCRKIERDVYASDAGKEALKAFVPVSLDCTVRGQSGQKLQTARANQRLMQKYGGEGYPFLAMLAPDGTLLHSFSGYKPTAAFQTELIRARTAYGRLKKLAALGKEAGTDSYEYNAEALSVHIDLQNPAEAARAGEKVLALDPKNAKGLAARAALAIMLGAQQEHNHDKAAEAYRQVRRHDPANERGVLAEAVFQHGLEAMRHVHADDPASRAKELQGPIADLKALIDSKVKPANPQRHYFLLGYLHKLAGQTAAAKDALEKAIAAAPASPMAASIRQQLKSL